MASEQTEATVYSSGKRFTGEKASFYRWLMEVKGLKKQSAVTYTHQAFSPVSPLPWREGMVTRRRLLLAEFRAHHWA